MGKPMKPVQYKHFWIVYGNIVLSDGKGNERCRGMNTLIVTDEHRFTRNELAHAQQALQMRFTTEAEQVPGFKIIDIPIISINHLGLMTEEKFHGDFSAPTTKKSSESKEIN